MTEKQMEWLQHLQPFHTFEDIPDVPQASNEQEQQLIIDCLIRCGAIPKKDLLVGGVYLGNCRNSSQATWNGNEFEYTRYKWGSVYKDSIKHFEDDMIHDVFIPFNKIN